MKVSVPLSEGALGGNSKITLICVNAEVYNECSLYPKNMLLLMQV